MKPIELSKRNIMFSEPKWEHFDLNIGLIRGAKHNFLIDTALGSGSIAPVLEYLKGDEKPVVVVNTHWHWDHIFGNFMFKDSLIIAHPLCRKLINDNWGDIEKECAKYVDGEMEKCLPNLLVTDKLFFPEDNIEIFFSPGHSEDCVSVYDAEEKILYAGDNIGDTADAIVPYIDTDIEVFRKAIALYKTYDFETCISGHNKPQGKDITARMEAALEDSWRKQQNG